MKAFKKLRWSVLLICVCCAVAACRGQASGGDDSGTGGGDAGMGGDGGGTTRPDAGQDGGAGDAGLAIDAGRPVPRGAPVPGCADAGDPALTASERTLLSLPADSWFEAPGSHLFDTCGPAATYGDGVYLISGCAAIVSAWGGGAYDSQRQRMIVWGGGHADYGGNELYAFNLKTFAWEQLTTPSRPPFGKDPLDDGQPVSRHTYDGVEFIAHRGTVFGWGGSRSVDGNGTGVTWEYVADAGWTNLGPPSWPASGSGLYSFGLAYDPGSRQVFVHLLAWFGAYDFGTNTWTRLFDFGYPPYTQHYDLGGPRTAAMHLGKQLFLSTGGGGDTLVYSVDAGTVLSLSAPWSGIGNHPSLARPAPGLDYDLATGQLVAWSGGAPIELDTSRSTYQWVDRSPAGAPAEQAGNGTYGRWRYVERYNVFVLVNDARQNVTFYKHTAGCGL